MVVFFWKESGAVIGSLLCSDVQKLIWILVNYGEKNKASELRVECVECGLWCNLMEYDYMGSVCMN